MKTKVTPKFNYKLSYAEHINRLENKYKPVQNQYFSSREYAIVEIHIQLSNDNDNFNKRANALLQLLKNNICVEKLENCLQNSLKNISSQQNEEEIEPLEEDTSSKEKPGDPKQIIKKYKLESEECLEIVRQLKQIRKQRISDTRVFLSKIKAQITEHIGTLDEPLNDNETISIDELFTLVDKIREDILTLKENLDDPIFELVKENNPSKFSKAWAKISSKMRAISSSIRPEVLYELLKIVIYACLTVAINMLCNKVLEAIL